MKVVYRLGPPLPPTFHRDLPTPMVRGYFEEGAFYCVGTIELAHEWKTMSDDDYFSSRPLYKITLNDDAVVLFFSGFAKKEKIVHDLTETVYTEFNKEEGPVIDPEECQLIAKLSDIVSTEIL